eukprot:m.74201 g.74201  ORF g.74201 m.74201 type:complete len:61 (+) comp12452_c0_seq6:638-820(+)
MLHFRITFLLYVFANHNFAELMVCWRTSAYIEYKAIDFDNEATTLIVGKDHGSDNILKTT